ncbi:MAG: hypothetical protein Q4B35_03205 [Slackia sp.]|nr:hypothetical protein [Slackia sp.]
MRTFGVKLKENLDGPWGPYVIDSVVFCNQYLAERGKRFYFAEVDVAQKIIDGMHCCDMLGWVVADSQASEFEPLWLADAYEKMERFEFVSVEWQEQGGRPVPVFDVG